MAYNDIHKVQALFEDSKSVVVHLPVKAPTFRDGCITFSKAPFGEEGPCWCCIALWKECQ